MNKAIDHNRRAWDERARQGRRFARPIREDELEDLRRAVDPWVRQEDPAGKQILCLGAGGGRQGVIYALAGGEVTVVDISEGQLEIDRGIAADRRLNLRTCRASIDDLSPLPDDAFDIVIQPVSTAYVPKVAPVYREVARVIRSGGLYVSQHKQPGSLQADTRRSGRGYELIEPYYRESPLPEVSGSAHREPGTLEYLHRWEQLVGEMCRAGFVIEDLTEPCHADVTAREGSFADRSLYVAPYVRIRARRIGSEEAAGPTIIAP